MPPRSRAAKTTRPAPSRKPSPRPSREEEEEEEEEGDGEDEEEEEEEEDDEPFDFDAHQVGSELFSLEVGAEFGGRSFAYSDPVTDNLRPYDVFGVPAILLGGELYPGATTGITGLQDVGVSLSYMHAIGLSSQTADGRFLFGTSWNRFHVGLRYRLRFGERDDNPVVLNLEGWMRGCPSARSSRSSPSSATSAR
ncbi:MAG: hypothetical protein JRI68_18435 [Deltaproteobacteria bacterium]|nr:hypothetical protein [Deltaproteobacteria bacterium]